MPTSRAQLDEPLQPAESYSGRGVKDELHGILYQLKLIAFFFMQGAKLGYDFSLGTEVECMEKFDDLVFRFTRDGKHVYRLLQAKHKQDQSHRIGYSDFVSNKDFSLGKYFRSFFKLSQRLEDKEELEDCILCTNADLKDDVKPYLIELTTEDEFFSHTPSSKRYQLRDGKPRAELYDVVIKQSELYVLAQLLVDHVPLCEPKAKLNKVTSLVKRYQLALSQILVKHGEEVYFNKSFVSGDSPEELPEGALNLRNLIEKMLRQKLPPPEPSQPDFSFGSLEQEALSINTSVLKEETDSISEFPKIPTREEFDKFCEKFVIAVAQPSEKDLTEILDAELITQSDWYNGSGLGSVLRDKMIAWSATKDGYYITSESASNFLAQMQSAISTNILIGHAEYYCDQLEQFADLFAKNLTLDSFLRSKAEKLLLVQSDMPLSVLASQVLCAVKQHQGYKVRGHCLFLQVNKLNGLEQYLDSALKVDSIRLIAIECDIDFSDTAICETLRKLLREFFKAADLKIVLLCASNKVERLKSSILKLIDISNPKEDSFKFDAKSLNQERLNSLQSKTVNSNGSTITLAALTNGFDQQAQQALLQPMLLPILFGSDSLVDELLFQSPLNSFETSCYVDRALRQKVHIDLPTLKVDKNIVYIIVGATLDTLRSHLGIKSSEDRACEPVLLSGEEIAKYQPSSNVKLNRLRYIVCQHEKSSTILEQVKKYCSHLRAIHVVKFEPDEASGTPVFTWQQSIGDMSNLVFSDQSTESIHERYVFIAHQRVLIISAEPGMGKSHLLRHCVSAQTSGRDVMFIPLRNHEFAITKAKFTELAIIFNFFDRIAQFKTLFAKCLFQYRVMHRGDTVLLFDGFDELGEAAQANVIALIKQIKEQCQAAIVVTTRPHQRNRLQNAFSEIAFELVPYNHEDRVNAIAKYWWQQAEQPGEVDEKTKTYATKLCAHFNREAETEHVIGVPLQAYMLATIYKGEYAAWQQSSDPMVLDTGLSIDIFQLYKQFAEQKYQIYLAEKKIYN